MQKSRYGISLFHFSEGRYTYENLQQMQELCNPLSLNIEERKIAIILVVGGVAEKYASCFCGQIYFNCEMWSDYECTNDLGNQYLRELITFLVKAGSLSDIWTSRVEESFWLIYVKDLLTKFFSIKRSKSVIAKLKSQDTNCLFERTLEEWEGEYDSEFLGDHFLSAIYEYPFLDVFNRKEVPAMEISNLNLALLFDEEYYHIGYDIFCKICESLKNFGSLGVIKNELLRAGVLVAEGCKRGYFTKRTSIIFENGDSVCKRMVRLRRVKIDKDFSLSLAEMIKAKTNY